MHGMTEGRSLGELFGDLSREIGTLVREEIHLARVELGDKLARVGQDAAKVAIGGAILYAGFLVFLFALVLILDLAIHMLWLSALIVAVVVLGIGYVLVRDGLDQLKHDDVTPRQTLETLQADVAWAKEQKP
jgi:hypothetical protein